MTKTLELLGYAPGDRVLIIHADDVGFAHGSNVAAFEGMAGGSLTCCSTIVPGPWFIETARLQRQHPDADIGVHMTLTAEYETYRWRSLTGDPSLHAPDGGMWRDVASVMEHVSAETAAAELRAQVELALAGGIDVTHLDTHMGTVMLPRYLPAYIDLAVEFRLPVFFPRMSDRRLAAQGDGAAVYAEQSDRLEALGWPLLDTIIHRTLSQVDPESKAATFREYLDNIRPGLTHFLIHPCQDGGELAAMTPEDGAHRAAEYDIARSPALREHCERRGIKLTGYREIRDRLRASLPARI